MGSKASEARAASALGTAGRAAPAGTAAGAPPGWRGLGALAGARRRARRARVSPVIGACLVVLLLFVAAAVFADLLAPHDPTAQNLRARLKPPLWLPGGTGAHPLGTDPLGRDLLSRLLHGARVSLAIGFAGAAIGLMVGSFCGLLSGFLRGPVDEALMFLVDVVLALPFLVVALTVIAVFGHGLPVLVALAGFSGWAGYTRLARGQALGAREQQYVLAARALGASPARLLLRHVLPNIAAPLVVLATFELTAVILLEASLSFLGLGIKPPAPSWGSMLGEGRTYLHTAWWIGLFPGLALMILTTAISLVGDWLRDVLDPTLRG